MAENSAIEWTDHTFNPWEGCQKVGPGCDHCYAETRNGRFGGGTAPNWGPGAPRRRTSVSNWRKPIGWQKDAAAFRTEHGRRQRVFCASLADVFDNAVDAAWRTDLFELIRATPDLDWLLLTKRIGNVANMLPVPFDFEKQYPNVWLGATIVNQAEADRDIQKLLATPAAVRFLSMEPLLGPVDLTCLTLSGDYEMDALNRTYWEDEVNSWAESGEDEWRAQFEDEYGRSPDDAIGQRHPVLDWVIVGGESGPGARAMHPAWARDLRDQCEAAGVPFLFKQWGEHVAHPAPNATWRDGSAVAPDLEPVRFERIGKKAAGRRLDGRTHDGFPLSSDLGLADPVAWEPEVGSVAALARAKNASG